MPPATITARATVKLLRCPRVHLYVRCRPSDDGVESGERVPAKTG